MGRAETTAGVGSKELSEKPLKDVDLILSSVRKEALRLGMKEGSLGPINGHDLLYFEGGDGASKILITAGIHGPEIGGPWSIHSYLSSLDKLPSGVQLTIFPAVNPTGIDEVSRKNRWGQAPNAGFVVGSRESPSKEGKLILAAKNFLSERAKDGHLALHEDYNLRDRFYMYANEKGYPGAFSEAMVNAGRRHFRPSEDGYCPNEDRPKAKVFSGIIFQDHDGSLEDMLFHMGSRHTAATETPQKAPLEARLRCGVDFIETFIRTSLGEKS